MATHAHDGDATRQPTVLLGASSAREFPGLVHVYAEPEAYNSSAVAVSERAIRRGGATHTVNLTPAPSRPAGSGRKGKNGQKGGSTCTWFGKKDQRSAGAPGGHGSPGDHGSHGRAGGSPPDTTLVLTGSCKAFQGRWGGDGSWRGGWRWGWRRQGRGRGRVWCQWCLPFDMLRGVPTCSGVILLLLLCACSDVQRRDTGV